MKRIWKIYIHNKICQKSLIEMNLKEKKMRILNIDLKTTSL